MIAIISGTNRQGSNTRKVAGQVETIYASLGFSVKLLDLTELPPEIFTSTAYEQRPPGFGAFAETVLESDGLVIVTPEYNGGAPGVLKYFLDMLPFPESLAQRPVCFVGLAAGIWGALRPVEQLQAVCGHCDAYVFPERVFIPGIGKMLDETGGLTNPGVLRRLESQARGFAKFVEGIRQMKVQEKAPATV
jgi:NAD(P)H-dependent FMN reductase